MPQPLLGPCLVEVANVDVSGRSSADRESDRRRECARVLAPANLQPAVVDHQALEVAKRIERCGRRRVDEGYEADVLVWDVSDVVQQTTPDNVANLLDSSLRVDVAQVDGSVAQVVDTAGGGGDGGGGDGLLRQSIRDEITISAGQHVRVPRRDAEVLSGVLLLRLGDVRTSVLAIVDPAGRLPLRFLRELADGLNGIGDGQEMDESDVLLSHNLNGIDGAELTQVLAQFLIRDVLRQVSEVDVARRARLLDGQSDRGGYLGGLAPADLDILALDAELFQDGIRVEMSGRAGIQEGDEGTILVRKQADRFNLAASHMAKNFLGAGVRRDVAKVHGTAGAGHDARAHRHGRGGLHRELDLALHLVVRAGRRLGRVELGGAVGRGRNDRLIHLRRHVLLHRARGTVLVMVLLLLHVLLLGLGKAGYALEVRAAERGRRAGLEGAPEQELGREQWGELHVEGGAWGGQIGAVRRNRRRLLRDLLSVNGRNVPPSGSACRQIQ